jgi:hypothetical protein
VLSGDGSQWEAGVVGGWASDGLTVLMKTTTTTNSSDSSGVDDGEQQTVRNVSFADLLQSKVKPY